MAEKLVALNLKSSVPVPQAVILPMRLVRLLSVDRRFLITSRAQRVPQGIVDYLRGDLRYAAWFEDAPAPSPESAAPPAKPEGGAAVDPDETWSADMATPVLREYAKRHGVAVAAKDKKDGIVTKLKAGRGDFEMTEDEPESPPKPDGQAAE